MQQISSILNVDVSIILPELVVAVAGIVVMVYDSFFPKQRFVSGAVSLACLAIAAVLLVIMWSGAYHISSAWNGMIVTRQSAAEFFVCLFVRHRR